MRLLFVSNVHPHPLAPTKGTFNGALVRALGAQHDVHVVCPISWIDRLQSTLKSPSRKPVLLHPTVTASYPTFWYPPKVLRSCYDRFLYWSIQRRLERILRTFKPDAVLSYWAHPDGAVALRIARQLGVPAISMVGGSDVLLIGRRGRRRDIILQTLQQSDAVIAVSEDIARQIVSDGVARGRVHVVRRGVDRDLFHPGDQAQARHNLGLPLKARIIIGVGRLVSVKDWSTLVSACGLLNHDGKAPICYLVGDGPLHGALRKQIDQLNLQCHVLLQGGQSQSALADWYRAADLVVLPSLSEGVPNVLLEAIASGTPWVATQVGGVPEIADPVWHRLVSPQQPAELAEAIRNSLQGERSTQPPRVEPLSWKESAEEVARIIRNCCSLTQPRTPIADLNPNEVVMDVRGREIAQEITTRTSGRGLR